MNADFHPYTRPAVANRSPKPKPEPGGVLGTLPASRPERLGRPRDGAARKPRAARPKPKPAPEPERIGAPHGTELVTTAIRAAGELAQIGVTVGGQLLKRTLSRIPRP